MIHIKAFLLVLTFCAFPLSGIAQKANTITHKVNVAWKGIQDHEFFTHLDIGATIGSTGLGIDVATPLGEYVEMRAGFSYMPRFEMSSTFRVQVGDSLDKKYDSQGHRLETKFDKLSGYMKTIVGYEIDDEIEMTSRPSFYNFKLLFDVFPFPDKRWHVTAGFFVGPSEFGRAYNITEEMPSLVSVTMWNKMYDKAYNWEPVYEDYFLPTQLERKLLQYGKMGFHAGNYTHDGVDSKGNEYKKGDKYMMVPDETSGMVKAYMKTNRFKPYLGFGYSGAISKDKMTQLSVDAGVMFWGGTPSVITHDGTDLTHDVEDVRGKLGKYVDAAKFFKVFPMIEVRLSRRIF